MKLTLKLMTILLVACACAHAQVVPSMSMGPAKFNYDLYYSDSVALFSPSDSGNLNSWRTTASGDLHFTNGLERFPFDVKYGAGYTWTLAGQSFATGLAQHLEISQSLVVGRWNATVMDDARETPQSTTTGFLGTPGSGEPIGTPNPPSGETILSVNNPTVENTAAGEIGFAINSATRISGGGGSDLIRFPYSSGLETDSQTAHAGISRRLDARDYLSGSYSFAHFSYSGPDFISGFTGTYDTSTVSVGYVRNWSRKLTTDVAAGPQILTSSQSAIVPSSTGVFASAYLRYKPKLGAFQLSYNHGFSGGGGYLTGATLDDINASFTRDLGRELTLGVTGAYIRSATLRDTGVTNGGWGGVEATKRLGRDFTAFANYTAITQSTSPGFPTSALNQVVQVIGFGIGYSPAYKYLNIP